MKRSTLTAAAVTLLLLVMIAQVALSVRQESPSWDEGDHIYSGYMNWLHGEYDLNPEHPPLVKLIATLPLLALDLKVPPRQNHYFKAEAYDGGRELLFRNAPPYGGQYTADTLLFRVRMAALLFGLILALVLFLAGQQMFSTTAGLIALTLFVFDPTILANAPFVTTDTGAACGFFATVFTFYRFVRTRTFPRMLACGIVLGLALCAKHSAVTLVPMLLVLAVVAALLRMKERPDLVRLLLGLAVIFATGIFVLWGVYSFRFSMHPSGVFMPPFAEEVSNLSPLMRGFLTFAERFHLLPESYLYGLADVQNVGEFMPTYINGKLYAHGQWFYFPLILSLKWTLGVLGLLALSIYAIARGLHRRRLELCFLLIPTGIYLAVAMAGPLNIGVRHVLPIFPFVFLLVAAGADWLIARHRAWSYAIAALLLIHVADSLHTFPNYIPYANVLWEGPSHTHDHFSDSATDWAQQLKWTRQWTDTHHVHDCWFAYFAAPVLLPADYGIPCKLLPTFDTSFDREIDVPSVIHGPILISYADLNGFEFGTKVRNPYQSLFERCPDDVIANGIAVFYGDVSLPMASAMQFQQQAARLLPKDAKAAVAAARKAVALVPDGFDANLALGDALAAAGDKPPPAPPTPSLQPHPRHGAYLPAAVAPHRRKKACRPRTTHLPELGEQGLPCSTLHESYFN